MALVDTPELEGFEILRRLGSGGQGSVFHARRRDTGRDVALKLLTDARASSLLRFKEEFRVAQRVVHPNVIALDTLHCDRGRWYFTMELVEGVDLVAYCRPHGRLDAQRLRLCLAQLTAAVDAMHAEGMLHRDLKPSNLLVTSGGRLVVLDLGMASSEPNERGEVVGTPEYMAPEQAAGTELGPAADWYAVGAVLYHALVGHPAFQGPAVEVMLRKQTDDPPPAIDVDATVPRDLDAICRALLARDPARRPVPHGARTTTLGGGTPFIGRERELAALTTVLEARAARPHVALVVGPSGIGKSALLAQAAARAAADHGAVVLASRCYERESVPGSGADGIVDALARALRRLDRDLVGACAPRRTTSMVTAFPVLRVVDEFASAGRDEVDAIDPFTRRSRAFGALRELLARLADRRPVVIILDDAQWADDETHRFLDSLLAPPDAPAVRVLAAWRAETTTTPPPPLDRATRIELDALDHGAAIRIAAELLRHHGRVADPDAIDALARESGGHPLLLDVLLDRAVSAEVLAAAPSIHAAFTERIGALDAGARAVLDAVLVAGTPVDESVLGAVLGVSAVAITHEIAALRASRLARSRRDGHRLLVEPFHDQVRAAGLEILAVARRRELHLAFANVLEARGDADPESVLDHLRGAGKTAAAARAAQRAGLQARDALAFYRAARLLGLALELGGDEWPEREGLRRIFAECLAAAGRGAEAAAQYLASAAGAPAADAVELRRLAAQQLLVAGHTAEGLAAIDEVLVEEGMTIPSTPRRALAQVAWYRLRLALRGYRYSERAAAEIVPRDLTRIDVCWHVGLGLSIVDPIRGQVFSARGLLLALRAGEPNRVGRALAIESGYRASGGTAASDVVESLHQTVMRLADATGNEHVRGLATGCHGVAAFLRGGWRDSARWCAEAATIFRERCQGVPWELATATLIESRARLALGDIAGLGDEVERSIRDLRDRGHRFGETGLRAAVLPYLHLFRGDQAAAAAEADAALGRWAALDFQFLHYYQATSRASADLYAGNAAAALARLDRDQRAIERAMLLRVQHVRASWWDLRARALLGCDGARQGEVAALAARLERERAPWMAPVAAVVRAALASRAGATEVAVARLRAALDGFVASEMTMHAMAVRWRLGAQLGGDAGRAMRDEAAAWARTAAIGDLDALSRLLVPG